MTAPAAPFEPDALDPTLYVRGVAHDVFRWMRENDPVHRDEKNGIWVIIEVRGHLVRRAAARAVLQRAGRAAEGRRRRRAVDRVDGRPEHARQRSWSAAASRRRAITELMDHIRELARELVDNVASAGECDFVDDIAKPLPLIVIAEMLGLAVEDRERLAHWSDTMMAAEGADRRRPAAGRGRRSWGEYITYLVGLLEDRRAHPQDDLISVLLSSADAGEISFDEQTLQQRLQDGASPIASLGLGSDELLSFLVLLLVAGNETTRNALSGGMLALVELPRASAPSSSPTCRS